MKETRSGEWTPGLSNAERETLFQLAEDSLRWCAQRDRQPFSYDAYALTPLLKTPMATFVTLNKGGFLRGCIGSLRPVSTLYESVHDNAVSAALEDPRFPDVTARELSAITVKVSVLSAFRNIEGPASFTLGEHGIVISKQGRRAVYLPEVAVEQRWTVEQTLSSLREKAGLPVDAWREGAHFQVFSSVVLSR